MTNVTRNDACKCTDCACEPCLCTERKDGAPQCECQRGCQCGCQEK